MNNSKSKSKTYQVLITPDRRITLIGEGKKFEQLNEVYNYFHSIKDTPDYKIWYRHEDKLLLMNKNDLVKSILDMYHPIVMNMYHIKDTLETWLEEFLYAKEQLNNRAYES